MARWTTTGASRRRSDSAVIADSGCRGGDFLGFGDGYVEIENVKEVGGTAVESPPPSPIACKSTNGAPASGRGRRRFHHPQLPESRGTARGAVSPGGVTRASLLEQAVECRASFARSSRRLGGSVPLSTPAGGVPRYRNAWTKPGALVGLVFHGDPSRDRLQTLEELGGLKMAHCLQQCRAAPHLDNCPESRVR